MTEEIRVLLVEDQTMMRQGLRTVLDLEEGMKVIDEAENGKIGLQKALHQRPDIILG
ncbi:response regulator [Chloroflexi bacterium TSY]|nr:response regulator [Chloroflexi bacterium TSY]